jgi:hypothetical protein
MAEISKGTPQPVVRGWSKCSNRECSESGRKGPLAQVYSKILKLFTKRESPFHKESILFIETDN